MSEVELKFILDEASPTEFWARVKASKLAKGRPTTKTLRSIYLDTPEHALKKAGMALRIRHDGARVPIVLTSRADSVRTRLASAAVGTILAAARRASGPLLKV
ncbi:CYTH domain-containing protein [Mesorhizobium sp. LjNodule214]|uniref:CYTH domain-containing protein n=1 Tax=Mesorhizobium sp. LjNodule214 TaxID=3342252 RepID=UPI003ECE3AC4